MKLVIVESPTKARTLSRFLGSDFQIMASMGHIRDLPKDKLGIEVDNNFRPEYVLDKEKQKIISELKKASVKAEEIILATDPDREGEAIAWHIAYLLKKKPAEISRIVFHEITQSAIKQALKNPGDINQKLVDAQQTRRVLDRLVGYKLSPLLWNKVRKGLSAGRVQSPAVKLIVEREREIKAFVAEEYWKIEVELSKCSLAGSTTNCDPVFEIAREQAKNSPSANARDAMNTKTLSNLLSSPAKDKKDFMTSPRVQSFLSLLIKINDKKAEVKNKDQADKIVADLKKADYIVKKIETSEVKVSPPPPYITSTLQRAASRLFYWSAKQTMRTAQQLYEKGLITYHRTDSVNLSKEALTMAKSYIVKQYGEPYYNTRVYKTKSKLAQEAHEAIRPTNLRSPARGWSSLGRKIEDLRSKIAGEEAKLYKLIFNRFVASQMSQQILEKTTIDIQAKEYLFRTIVEKEKFSGWKIIYPKIEAEKTLPNLKEGENLKLIQILPQQKFTQPPLRYTEGSLIKALEEKGIGRPSTYAPIISTIQTRQYVEKVEGFFQPTQIGFTVNDFLVKYFCNIIDYDFTAHMEDNLDNIALGKEAWVPVIEEFYKPFNDQLTQAYKTAQRERIPVETTGEKCPLCAKGEQVIRIGRFGKFLSCSRFPECKWKAVYIEKLEGVKCLKCGGEVIIRKTKRGKRFYGCSNWPKCKWASWHKPSLVNK